MKEDVHLLTFTSLYPSAARPRHGIFIESRLKRLVRQGGLNACVIAPVPWFPFQGRRWGDFGRIASTPRSDIREGLDVRYPRYLSVPGVDLGLKAALMAQAGLRDVEVMLGAGVRIDAVDAHYLYPDGVAAADIAKRIGKPLVLSARGTDVNVVAKLPGPRRRIMRAIEASSAVIAVSSALKASLVALGVPGHLVTVLRNGVDLALFRPEDRSGAREQLGLPVGDAPMVASVGNLVPEKGHDVVLRAVQRLPGVHALVVGRGPLREDLERTALSCGVAGRTWFLEEMPQDRLRLAYSAANALVLASEREGWPNVVLESAACGTPVVAFPVGGVPEILRDLGLGTMAYGDRSAASLAEAIQRLLMDAPSRESVRAAASRFAWDPILEQQLALYRQVAGLNAAGHPELVGA